MRSKLIDLQLLLAVFALVFFITCPEGSAQDKADAKADKAVAKMKNSNFCSNEGNWSGDKVSHKELREMNVAAMGTLNVDGGKNGGISVKGENRTDILIRACVQAWGKTAEEAQGIVKGIRVDTGSTIKADSSGDENWSVSYQISVPHNTDLNLTAHNGGISIYGVEGNLEFKTLNGGLHLAEISGTVKGRTTNGGVHVSLSGAAWKGNGLDLETTNGGVHLSVPQNFAANFETGTTNGGFHSSFSQLELPKAENGERRRNGGRITAAVNGGGAPVRLMTTNGGVHISSNSDKPTM